MFRAAAAFVLLAALAPRAAAQAGGRAKATARPAGDGPTLEEVFDWLKYGLPPQRVVVFTPLPGGGRARHTTTLYAYPTGTPCELLLAVELHAYEEGAGGAREGRVSAWHYVPLGAMSDRVEVEKVGGRREMLDPRTREFLIYNRAYWKLTLTARDGKPVVPVRSPAAWGDKPPLVGRVTLPVGNDGTAAQLSQALTRAIRLCGGKAG